MVYTGVRSMARLGANVIVLPTILVVVQGHRTTATIDTGATRSLHEAGTGGVVLGCGWCCAPQLARG